VNGKARTETIKVLAGRELLHAFQPSEGSAKTFCSECGSNLFGGGWPESENVSVRLSGLDTYFDHKPDAHIFMRSVAPWEPLPEDGIERFEVRGT
jgi:hypothetical protein